MCRFSKFPWPDLKTLTRPDNDERAEQRIKDDNRTIVC